MILSIVAYGSPVLKQKATVVNFEEEDLQEFQSLVDDMYETMYNASGVGLAAPQVGVPKRIFIVDGTPMLEENKNCKEDETPKATFKQVFINPTLLEETGELWAFEEGCLSIPEINIIVNRKPSLKIRYQNIEGVWKEEVLDGIKARIIQHEFDHLEGVLFTDYASSLKKKLLKKKLENIANGKIKSKYPMKFPIKKSRPI